MDTKRAQELLDRERERIKKELARLLGDESQGEPARVDQHAGDAGSELFEQERDQSLIEALRGEMAAVERAEKRLQEGAFGLSVESGERIPDERLEVQPWAERTVDEQTEYEAARRYSGGS